MSQASFHSKNTLSQQLPFLVLVWLWLPAELKGNKIWKKTSEKKIANTWTTVEESLAAFSVADGLVGSSAARKQWAGSETMRKKWPGSGGSTSNTLHFKIQETPRLKYNASRITGPEESKTSPERQNEKNAISGKQIFKTRKMRNGPGHTQNSRSVIGHMASLLGLLGTILSRRLAWQKQCHTCSVLCLLHYDSTYTAVAVQVES